jgi:uncharacterized protein (DUF2252 family)
VSRTATPDEGKHGPKGTPEHDPGALADRQLTLDRERTKRFPDLFVRKLQRMSASPLAYLRGAAPLFFEILSERPELAEGPGGEGWIVGDMHLENFGAYRPDPLGAADDASAKDSAKKVRFDLNDFDDAIIGPWRLDVLRLTTSLLLGGRELGANGLVALSLCDLMLDAWARSAFDGAPLPAELPPPIVALTEQVRARSTTALLDARTAVTGGKRHFVRGPRYAELPPDIVTAVPEAFSTYIAGLPDEDRPHKGSLDIVDCALRIAGTGSLGGLRIAVLVKGKGGPDGGWIFDMKEQGEPSASILLGARAPAMVPADRVTTSFRACVERPPRMLGSTTIHSTTGTEKLSMFVRKLSPQEDKLNLRRLKGADLPSLATYLGALLGSAHARAATKVPKRWAAADLATIRAHAIALAGLHEAIYLDLCERMRTLLPKPEKV